MTRGWLAKQVKDSKRSLELRDPYRTLRLEREVEMLQGIIQRVAALHPPKYAHECPEWDGLRIDEYDPEFNACLCYREEICGKTL